MAHTWFRWLWIASVASNIGTWMQNVGAGWEMAILAPTPMLVALVQTATTLPVFLLGVPAGAIGDLFDRRKTLIVTQALMLVAAAALGILTLTGKTGPQTLLWLTFALGLGSALNGPAWQAIMPELVPTSELAGALALNSVGFNVARAVGPALGGLVVAWVGTGWAFVLNAVSFVGVMIVLYEWRRDPERVTESSETVLAAILTGVRYVRFAPALHAVIIRSGAFIISASAIWSLLPLIAKVELHSESSGFGFLLGCLGTGSIIGAFILTHIRHRLPTELIVTCSVALFGVVNLLLAYFTSYAAMASSMVVAGMAWMWVNSNLNTTAQSALPDWVRARGLGVYLLVFQGAMAVGSIIWGEIAERFGLRSALAIAGAALCAAAALTSRLKLPNVGEINTTPSLHLQEPMLVVDRPPDHGPVLVTVEYLIDPGASARFHQAMRAVRRIRRRDGAVRWGLFEDAASPGRFIETFVVESWAEHLRQHDRMTISDREMVEQALAFHRSAEPPKVTHWIAGREESAR